MSALILAVKRQADRTIRSPKRLNVIMLILVAIAVIGAFLLVQAAPQAIEYPRRYLTATPAVLCPGETFTYPVQIKIDQGDAVSRITEGWCNSDTGICPRAFQSPEVYVNFVEPYEVSTPATRTVPTDLPPGAWQLRHCNETHASGTIDVVCYAVDVTVEDCAK